MSEHNNIHYIENLEFTLYTNQDVKDNSSVYKEKFGINLPESYDNSEPKRNGLVDTRLGITDKSLRCSFCGLDDKNCPGHFGHTELSTHIFHIGFLPTIKSILNCICLRSCKLLCADMKEELSEIHESKHNIFNKVKNLCSKIQVSNIGIPVPKIKIEKQKNSGAVNFITETSLVVVESNVNEKKNVVDILNAHDIYNIFRNISDEDWELMGFNPKIYRPEDLIISNFPIPPVAIRPSLRADLFASQTYEDEITHKLADIIKTNDKLRKEKDKEKFSGEDGRYSTNLKNYLQYHIATYYENDKDAFLISEQKVGGKQFKSISERLKTKQGRIRGNLLGKRVNYSARTVITGDPNIRLDEIGIPVYIAMELTFPEIVTPYNIDNLTKLVRNGRYIYPGANFVIQGSSLYSDRKRAFDLSYRKKTIKLRYGDVVARHLINGDPILFNRQPSLHKLSMMAHKARIIDDHRYSSLRMNVSATSPYNADFDGDEMNIHAPQSIQTQSELAMIADIKKQIISPKDGRPCIVPIQDTLMGMYKLSHDNVKVDWRDFMNLILFAHGVDFEKLKIQKNKEYSGKFLFSHLLPNNLTISNKSIEIKNGDHIDGIIRKKESKDIVYNILKQNTHDITMNFIDSIQRIIINWILMDGFTVGLGDCIVPKKVTNTIITELEKKKLEIDYLITEIENNPELLDSETFEASIQSNLSAQKGEIQKILMDSLDNSNNFYVMVNSGSKASPTNIMQIMGALGQDIFKFARMGKTVLNRSLCHFFQNDDRASARGYIEHSYYEGLSPQEFFFHHMTGREGLIDTAIKTAETGYISRRLFKALEDIGVKYDGLIRTGNNNIIQFVYGDNNINQVKQVKLNFNSIKLGNKELSNKYSLDDKELKLIGSKSKVTLNKLKKANSDYIKELKSLRNQFRVIQKLHNLNYKTLTTSFPVPVDIKRLINNERYKIYSEDKNTICNPEYILDKIKHLVNCENTKYIYMTASQIKDKSLLINKDESIGKTLFKYSLYEFLCPKKIIMEYKLSKFKFDKVIDNIISGFKDSVVDAGEMVGGLAAQHIGEPSTQMTLNTFHSTGSGSVGMQGVPRIEEIIRATINIKTPLMSIYGKPEIRLDKDKMLEISASLSFTIIKDLINDYEVIYDKEKYMKKDKVSNPFYVRTKSNVNKKAQDMEWLIRIKLNRDQMIEHNVSLIMIKNRFVKFWKYKLGNMKGIKKIEKTIINSIISSCILSNYDNSETPIIHIKFSLSEVSYNLILDIKDWFFNNIKIKGIEGINKIDNLSKSRFISFNNKDENFEEQSEYAIITDGINMIDIRKLDNKNIDFTRLYCNNIKLIYHLYGIEAARSAIMKELDIVYAGKSVGYHHLCLLTDLMVNTGKITSIDRHGLNKLDRSVLTKAAFEMPMEQFVKAAINNEVDKIDSVSSQIIVGRTITGGTGLPKLMVDVDMIQNSEYIENPLLIERSKFIKLQLNELFEDIITKDVKDIFMPS